MEWKIKISPYFLRVVIPLHLLMMGMIYYRSEFRPGHIAIILFIYLLIGGVGLELGFHRMLCHKNFVFKSQFIEKLVILLGSFAFQGSAPAWVSLHRNHHRHVDTVKDHQAPLHGMWSSYIGWTIDPSLTEKIKLNLIRDLIRRKFLRLVDKYYYLMIWSVSGLILLISPIFFFTCFLPGVLLSFHVSSVNNLIGHNQVIGKRPFPSNNWATDVPIAALFSWGISFQNTHHKHPEEIDYSRYTGGIDPAHLLYLGFKKFNLVEKSSECEP